MVVGNVDLVSTVLLKNLSVACALPTYPFAAARALPTLLCTSARVAWQLNEQLPTAQ